MIRKLLYRITNHLPARIINDGETPYLERYYVATLFGVCIYLHQFVGSDPDRGLHDHPWPWAFSLILAGSYLEETRSGKKPVRWFNFLLGDSFHRVLLRDNNPVWTLFCHRARRSKRWGFMRSIHDEAAIFTLYPQVNEPQWWLTAPKGREIREQGDSDGN